MLLFTSHATAGPSSTLAPDHTASYASSAWRVHLTHGRPHRSGNPAPREASVMRILWRDPQRYQSVRQVSEALDADLAMRR